jgi:hypothetical protein
MKRSKGPKACTPVTFACYAEITRHCLATQHRYDNADDQQRMRTKLLGHAHQPSDSQAGGDFTPARMVDSGEKSVAFSILSNILEMYPSHLDDR